jgi:serine/threonine protein kinase
MATNSIDSGPPHPLPIVDARPSHAAVSVRLRLTGVGARMVTWQALASSSASAADSSAEPRTLGKYELVRLIARGGMGEVHLARLSGELGFEKLLVIKTVRAELAADPRFVELFATEAKTAVGLSHPNITPIYELGRAEDGSLYTAMGWVDGPSLQVLGDRLRELDRRLDPGAALFIAREVLEGLAHAHQGDRGRPPIVHRDITPRNVLVDRSGRVQIVDFGIAKPAELASGLGAAQSPGPSRRGGARAAGSVGYMSPEQARGEAVDPRADVFSVGCVLYELLTNERAFASEGVWMSPDLGPIPPSLHEPLACALDLDPKRRYADADAFRRALAPILAELAPTFGSRDLGDLLRELFPDGAWEDEQRPHVPGGETPATNLGVKVQTFATRLRPTTEPDFITGVTPALPPELGEIVDVREPDPTPTQPEIAASVTTAPQQRRRMWPIVLAIVAVAAGLGYAVANSLPEAEPVEEPTPQPSDVTPIDPDPKPPLEREPSPTPPEQPIQASKTIELDIRPAEAEVRVDGRTLAGPPHVVALDDAPREIAVLLADHHEQIVTIDPAAPPSSPLVITLTPLEPGSLSVVAPNVAWAEVWLDGSKIGNTPLTDTPVLEGKHKLEVRCTAAVCGEDRSLLSRSIRIKPGRENKFSVD